MGWDWSDWSRRYSAGEHAPLPLDNQPYRDLGLAAGPQHALLVAGLWNGRVDQLTRETLLDLVRNQDLSDSAVFTLINETKSRLDLAAAFRRARSGTYPVSWAAIGATMDAHVRRHLGTRPDTLLDRLTRGATSTGLWLGVWARDPVPLLASHQAFLQAAFSTGANRLYVLAAAEFHRDTRNLIDNLKLGDRATVDSSQSPFHPGVTLIVRSGHGADGAIYLLKPGPAGWTEQSTGGREEAQDLFAQFERLRRVSPKPAAQAV